MLPKNQQCFFLIIYHSMASAVIYAVSCTDSSAPLNILYLTRNATIFLSCACMKEYREKLPISAAAHVVSLLLDMHPVSWGTVRRMHVGHFGRLEIFKIQALVSAGSALNTC